MPQDFKELQLSIKQGAPASAVPRSWFIFINNVLRYLTIRNGRLITNGDKWTIECDSKSKFTGVVLAGKVFSESQISGPRVPTDEYDIALKIDYWNVNVEYVSYTGTLPSATRAVDYIPQNMLNGLIVLPWIPHYAE